MSKSVRVSLTRLEEDVNYLSSKSGHSVDVGFKFANFLFECFMDSLEVHVNGEVCEKIRDDVIDRVWNVAQELKKTDIKDKDATGISEV